MFLLSLFSILELLSKSPGPNHLSTEKQKNNKKKNQKTQGAGGIDQQVKVLTVQAWVFPGFHSGKNWFPQIEKLSSDLHVLVVHSHLHWQHTNSKWKFPPPANKLLLLHGTLYRDS